MTEKYAPFDPGDPFNAMAESFRRQVATMAREALSAAIYRDLPTEKQIECFSMGVLTGLIGCVFVQIKLEGRDHFMEFVTANLPQVRDQVEGLITAGDL